jgi:hypothetical protein
VYDRRLFLTIAAGVGSSGGAIQTMVFGRSVGFRSHSFLHSISFRGDGLIIDGKAPVFLFVRM